MIYDEDVVSFTSSLNLWSGLGHLALAIAIGVAGNISLRPTLYTSDLQYSSNGLLPPTYTGTFVDTSYSTFPLTILTVVAYSVSAFFSFGTVFLWPNFYLTQLEKLASPVRWTSHIVSSTFLVLVVAFIAGVQNLYMLLGVASMQITSKILLALTETYSRPASNDDTWELSNAIIRAKPHLVAFVPFSFLWVVILMQFANGVSCLAKPAVWAVIFAYFAFSVFYFLPQIFQIFNLPSMWVTGEGRFIMLEIACNVTMGILLLLSVLRSDTLDAAVISSSADATCFVTTP